MNIMRTVPQNEARRWVNLLFQEGPHPGADDPDPLTYPLARKLGRDVVGGFLYLIYQGIVIGYNRIDRVQPHAGDAVGSEDTVVSAGDCLLLESPLKPMPYLVSCHGFRNYRYIDADLHELGQAAAQAEVQQAGLSDAAE